jgi:hypothetical protein
MQPIAQQRYYKIQREVDLLLLEQRYVEQERIMYLFNDKVVTQYREFPLESIFDISYKEIGAEGGIMYLHTNHAVYSYNVKSSPESFIKAYKYQIK